MKEITRMLIYTGSTIVVVLFMVWLTSQEGLSGNFLVSVAVLLVIIIPIAAGVYFARKEKRQRERDSSERY